jgi:acetyltransferase
MPTSDVIIDTIPPTSGTDSCRPDVLGSRRDPLDVFFQPRRVAVIGATETAGSVGRAILWNLIATPFGGTVFPVNPKRSSVFGIKAYPDIGAVPEKVDLAIIVTPAPVVPAVIAGCADAGVKAAIIISAGFKEIGAAGTELEQDILRQARGRLRIIGPNCLGVMNPWRGLNATFAGAIAQPGSVGFISQSGALCTAILDWSLREMVGFSSFISLGSMLDVGWGDLIQYLGDDPRTHSIVLYMETIGDARSFLSAAREVALIKPIIVLKPGRTEAAARAASSHTGSLAGSDDVLEAAFRRCGVLRVNSISDLFNMSEVLGKQPRPAGPRLTIVTNAGGPGVIATDALIGERGELAELSKETKQQLDAILPANWSHNNPIDILGDAGPDRYAKTIEIVTKDPNSDGVLVTFTPQAMSDPTQTAAELKKYAHLDGKPILASWMGGTDVAAGEDILNRAGIPTFAYPDAAASAFVYMSRYSYNLRALYETPAAIEDSALTTPERQRVQDLVQRLRSKGRSILTEAESKMALAAYGIPTVETVVASSEDEAVAAAERLGYPTALKLNSETITHKTDVGGVRLNLANEAAVRGAYRAIESSVAQTAGLGNFLGVTVQPMVDTQGYELIVGSSVDPQFGPTLLFGAGGQLVEVFKDRALALPPLNTTLARRLIEHTRVATALRGVRGRKPIDMAALERLLVRFSSLVVEQRGIREIEINPLLASPEGLLALDARVILHGPEIGDGDLPKLAIRPYPVQYVGEWKTREGEVVTIRPIRPEDEPLMVRFHEHLTERSVYLRYFHFINFDQRVAHERLLRICFIDYDREMALVAERRDPLTGERQILGVGRLTKLHGFREAEFAAIVTDAFQGRGLGFELVRRLVEIGRAEKLERIIADILPDNSAMQKICRRLGFHLRDLFGEGVIKADIAVSDT